MCDPLTIMTAVSAATSLFGALTSKDPEPPKQAALAAGAVKEGTGADVALAGSTAADKAKKKAAPTRSATGGSTVNTPDRVGVSIL